MSLFGRNDNPAPPEAPAPQQFAVSAATKRRIGELRGEDGRGALFTSDLSVNEFLLVRQTGFEPIGLVMGSSMYHVGFVTPSGWAQSMEVESLSQAMYTARELAMTRMEEEAHALGADGVVGMRLEVGRYDWAEDLADFMAVGTAVRFTGAPGTFRTNEGKPFTSDLSGQDFAVLMGMGYAPRGLVMGSCVYHVAHQTWKQYRSTANKNVEMVAFTQAMYDTREIAMERMQTEAKALGAEGIVGARVEEKSHGWDSHVIEFLAVGTAVSRHPSAKAQPPTLVLPVTG
jgi:uncharacterized protein YbjQ (UPF0145 family)